MPADNTEEIARIRELLNAGVTSVENDGQATTFDQDALRRRLRELLATDEDHPVARPRVASIDLSSAW